MVEHWARAPRVFTLDDGCGLQLRVLDIGATWWSCHVRVPDEGPRELLLGHADPTQHLLQPGYMGSMVGRYANRIAQARFELDGRTWHLLPNEGPHQLHGGPDGFHRRRWTVQRADERSLRLQLVSPDGDQGFPGRLVVELAYTITAPGHLRIAWQARCGAACPVNLSNHAYFNLDRMAPDVSGHRLQLGASRMLPVDAAQLPCADPLPVQGTRHDLRQPIRLGDAGEFDHAWLLDTPGDSTATAARLHAADGRVQLALGTTLPALQCYTGQHLNATRGRAGVLYHRGAGIALEPEFLPDSPNHPEWPQPSCVLRPGAVMAQHIDYRFTVDDGR